MRVALLFFCLASAASSLVSLNVHGRPSIGFSGVSYAIQGFLIRFRYFDWMTLGIDYAFNQVFYYLATRLEVDHVAHAGGFLFGYLTHDFLRRVYNARFRGALANYFFRGRLRGGLGQLRHSLSERVQ